MVPRMKPSCTALVSRPIPEMLIPQARVRSGAALLALNQSDVPNNCAIAIVVTGLERTISTGPVLVGEYDGSFDVERTGQIVSLHSICRSAPPLASPEYCIVCLTLALRPGIQHFVQCRALGRQLAKPPMSLKTIFRVSARERRLQQLSRGSRTFPSGARRLNDYSFFQSGT
jgi:hypothetical protein